MNPVKLLVTSSFITLQNLVAVFHAVCAHVGGPKIWGHWALPLGMEACMTPRNTLLFPTCVTMPNLVILGQTIPEKFEPWRPGFQGHSKSLELTRIGRLPMTCY